MSFESWGSGPGASWESSARGSASFSPRPAILLVSKGAAHSISPPPFPSAKTDFARPPLFSWPLPLVVDQFPFDRSPTDEGEGLPVVLSIDLFRSVSGSLGLRDARGVFRSVLWCLSKTALGANPLQGFGILLAGRLQTSVAQLCFPEFRILWTRQHGFIRGPASLPSLT